MRGTVNPLLHQVLYRRRMRRYARLSGAGWVFFGGLHITVWWAAFEHNGTGLPQGFLGAVVWPLLLAATASFVCLVVYAARWFLAPGDPQDYGWLERTPVSALDAIEPDTEPTIMPAARLAS
jgi:hypothetical protein